MKERLIGVILSVFGLQYIVSGVYHVINFEKLHIIPGVLYLLYPSPTDYYIPLVLLGIACFISGLLLVLDKKHATYLSNIALVGLMINSFGNVRDFEIDTIIWNLAALIFSIYSLIFLNVKEYKSVKQITLRILIIIIGLLIIYLGPSNSCINF